MLKYFLILLFNFVEIHFSSQLNIFNNHRNLEELSDDIVILHVNDVHCGINDTIGYDGFMLYRDELKKRYKYIISVDAGDHIQGGTLGAISNGEAIIKIMNEVGFDVAILGNHEFDYGIEQLIKLDNNITSKYICANFCYKENKTTIFEPHKIIEIGGKRIAFIGLLTPLTFSKTYLITIKDPNGEPLYDFLTNNNTQELYDTIQDYIDELKKDQKADYIILLTHMGMRIEKYKSDELLSKLENVDAVIDGHTHRIYNVTSPDRNGKNIYIAQTGTKLQTIGKIILKKDNTITSEIISEIPEPSNKTNATQIYRDKANRWVDKNMNNFINGIWSEYEDLLNDQFGHSNYDIIVKEEENSPTDSIYCRIKECTLGNLITDAVREAGKAEITIINGGAIRNNLYKGNLTKGELINILPWFNNIVIKRLTGQCILDALEFGVSEFPLSSGGFPQVSGITFDIDPDINSTVLTDETGVFLNVTGKRRVSNVKINGKNLEVNKIYNASLIEFTAKGGDGYSMLAEFDILNEALITDTDAFCYYIQNNLKGEIPKIYNEFQGRINFKKNSYSSLPNILFIGFDKYEFLENSHLIKFLTHLRIANFSDNKINNITLKTNIIYKNNLRNLEELEINCDKQSKKQSDIYTFICSKKVNSNVDKLSYDNNIKINGQTVSNIESLGTAKIMGENIQNQSKDLLSSDFYILENSTLINKDNKIIINGINNSTDLSSNNSDLIFVENNQIKNISCIIEKEKEENIFKLICNPKSSVNADLNLNNFVNLKDKNKNMIISYNEGNSKANIEIQPNHINNLKKNTGLSAGAIIAIIIPCIAALIAIILMIYLLNLKINPNPTMQNIPNSMHNNSSVNINQ